MSSEQSTLLIQLISLALVFVSPVVAFLSYYHNVRKDKKNTDNELQQRFKSIEDTMLRLTSSIDLLNERISQMNKDMEKNIKDEEDLNKRVNKHDVKLADHEARISHLEEGDK